MTGLLPKQDDNLFYFITNISLLPGQNGGKIYFRSQFQKSNLCLAGSVALGCGSPVSHEEASDRECLWWLVLIVNLIKPRITWGRVLGMSVRDLP